MELRGYQVEGVERLLSFGRDAILADEPGLGKTAEVAEYINRYRPQSVLVVCPASLRVNWGRELETWLTWECHVVIVSYDAARKMDEVMPWGLIVFDEAHYLKDPDAKRTRACLSMSAGRRLFLTGTPVVNRPMDLWPILESMGVKLTRKEFGLRYCAGHLSIIRRYPRRYAWDFSGSSNEEELSSRLASTVMVRRTKREVLGDLPAKIRQVVVLPEGPSGETEGYRRAMIPWIEAGDLETPPPVPFGALAKVRHDTAMAKLPEVAEYVDGVLEEEGKVVVMAWHREVINALAARYGADAVLLYGGMTDAQKQASVDAFQAGKAKVFVGQILAAGTGITLVAAKTIVFAEDDWVPGNITQAEDRIHRLGQTCPVRCIHLAKQGTVDLRMIRALIDKQETIDRILSAKPEEAKND